MKRKHYLIVISLFYSFLSIGCDKLCKSSVEDVATVQNKTGRILSLSVCTTDGETTVNLPADFNFNKISLGLKSTSNVQGGTSAADSCANNGQAATDMSLAPASFSQVRLCLNITSNKYIIIENNQLCPPSYSLQTSTYYCN